MHVHSRNPYENTKEDWKCSHANETTKTTTLTTTTIATILLPPYNSMKTREWWTLECFAGGQYGSETTSFSGIFFSSSSSSVKMMKIVADLWMNFPRKRRRRRRSTVHPEKKNDDDGRMQMDARIMNPISVVFHSPKV
jgi:hypothetical protein